ncbi:MAG: hypothetical protein ACI841_001838 [Planctomycetota bacterium]|jgi:hypothetical protein
MVNGAPDTRLESPGIQLPLLQNGEELHLQLMQWLSLGSDDSYAQISVFDNVSGRGPFVQIGSTNHYNSNVWSPVSHDISAYAGELVRFSFVCDDSSSSQGSGWFVDVVRAPFFAVPYCFCESNATCGNIDPFAGCVNSTGTGARLSASGRN